MRGAGLAVWFVALGACGNEPVVVDAASPLVDAAQVPRSRLLLNSVSIGGAQLLFQDEHALYVEAMLAAGITGLHVNGQLRERCYLCAPQGPLDINTAPAIGVYDFSHYFERLDYAISQKGMKVVLTFSLAGRFDGDAATPGAYPALPAYFSTDDVMTYRDGSGADVVYASGQTKVLRFEKPAVRAIVLDYVTAVVTQFRARYGDAILYYGFSFNTTAENEYALVNGSYVDTSPDAEVAFQAWLAARYGTPQAVSTAWGRTPAFTDFSQIEILDGQPPPAFGSAPPAFLDFMAYREAALAAFLGDIRDRIHAAGGRAIAQYGSVWDRLSAMRGTYGFGRQIAGYDLVLVDDAPGYPHGYSMDYVRTNSPGVPFGNEIDAPCVLGCASGDYAMCCDAATFPMYIDATYGMARMDAQTEATFALGATYLDLANWDNFYRSAFDLFAPSIDKATMLAQQPVSNPVAVQTQQVSLRDLYVHHEDSTYIADLVAAHDALAAAGPVTVVLQYDLAP